MEENKINLIFEKNEFRFRILYLIRKNLPKSEFLYLLMFFLKYIGLILFSISLNVFDTRNTTSNNSSNSSERGEHIPMHSDMIFQSDHSMDGDHERGDFHDKENNNINDSDNSNNLISNNMVQKIFRKFLMNGDNYKILNNSYQLICMLGFFVLIIYIFLWIFVYFYMRKKYHSKTQLTITDKKINEINQNDTVEKRLIRYLTYFLFLIVFFHQYILEYYIFGFLGYLLNQFDALNTSEDKNNDDNYTKYMNEHLQNLKLPEMLIIFINLVTIIIILAIFILFILINSSKTLYITKNYPLYSNDKNLVINCITLNLNPLFGIVNYFSDNTKLKYVIIFIIIIICLILIKTAFSYYFFSPLPYKLDHLCIFIEFFASFGCVTNLITYLTKSEINSTKFSIIKAIFELLNALVFTFIFIKKKKEKNMKIFSDNLFLTNLKSLNPSGIYYYITRYIKYSKNKSKNYMTIFKLIQNHVLNCQNKDCPGNKLLPKSLSYSIFTDFKHYSKNTDDAQTNPHNQSINVSINEKKEEKKEDKKEDTVIRNIKSMKRSVLKSLNSKNNIKTKNDKARRTSINIDLTNNDEDEKLNQNKKMLEDVEFKMIGEQEIINRINFLYRRKKLDYLQTYIFLHLQYIIKIKQNYRLALYFLSKYSQSEIKFSFLSQYYMYEIKHYINNSILNQGNINLINDPYIKKYKEENIKIEQLMDYISLFNIVRKIIKVSCESIIQFYSFRRELHNSLSLQKYKKTKIYQVLQSSERIQSAIYKLQFLLDKLNKDKKHRLESIELSYLICNFFKLLEGRIPQEILSNVKPILYFKDSLYEQLINEFHLFMMNNPLIIGLKQNDTFNIIYFTNILMKKLGFSFSDLKYKDFHEKLFPGNQELIKEHTLILKQFLFFYSNTYNKAGTFIKSKEGYLVPVNITTKVFPSFVYDFLLITNVKFNENLEKGYLNINNINNNKEKNDNKNIDSNRLINTYSFMLNNEYEIFTLTKNFYLEYNLNQAMFRELRINFCQFFCIDENKLSIQIINERKRILKENPNLNNQISLRESNKAYTIFQNISMKNLFKIREEKLIITYNYPEIFIYEKIDKKKLIKKIPEIINIIDEIGLDYDWYLKLQKYRDRLTFNIDESKLTFNTFNFEQYFEVIFSIKKLGNIIYFIVNLNEIYNRDIEMKMFSSKLNNRKSFTNSKQKNFKKMGTRISNKFNKTSIKSADGKSRKSVLATGIFQSKNTLTKIHVGSSKNIPGTVMPNKKLNFNIDENKIKDKDKNDKDNIQLKKTQKNSVYDNTEYLKSMKHKKRFYSEDDENTPLITKDKFNDILSKKNKINRIFIILLYIFIIISLLLIIIKTIQSQTAINENLKVLEFTINLEILKVDLYLEAILSLHYCIIEQQNTIMKFVIPEIQKTKLDEMMDHLNQIQNHIETILNNKNSFSIFQVIEDRFTIASITDDLSIIRNKTDLLEEMRRLSYVIGNTITDSDDRCEIEMIYEYSIRGNDKDFFKDYKPTYKQKLFFYFVYNALINYKTTFESLSEECDSSLLKMWNIYEKTQMYFIVSVIIDLLIFFVIFCIKYCFDTSFYQLLFLYYYKIEDEQKKFETQIYYLYKMNLEFNYDNIKYFEYIKKNCDNADLYDIANNNNNNNSNNNNSDLNNYKKRYSIRNKNEALEENSMNGSLLNSSMNGSSVQFLNRANKLNLNNRIENIKNTPYEDKIEEKPENNISQEETIESLMKFITNILPNSHQNSLFFIIINFIIYIGLCGICIYEIINQIYEYDFAINLSMNILERTPRIMELVLYSTITVIVNKTTTLIPNREHQSPYLKYFSIDSLYYSEEMLQKYFQGNFYGQLLKDNLKLKYNLEGYLYNNKYNLFKNVQYWEEKLNTIGEFCINLPIGLTLSGGVYLNNNITNLYEFIQEMNTQALICKNQSSGMKDSGIKIEFNYILQEITTKYIEYIIYDRTNADNLSKARLNFINNTDFEKVISDVRMYLLFYFNIITDAVKKDFEKQNNETNKNQIIYSILFLIVNVEIIISLVFIFSKTEKYKKLFSYFSTIPKDDIINI